MTAGKCPGRENDDARVEEKEARQAEETGLHENLDRCHRQAASNGSHNARTEDDLDPVRRLKSNALDHEPYAARARKGRAASRGPQYRTRGHVEAKEQVAHGHRNA